MDAPMLLAMTGCPGIAHDAQILKMGIRDAHLETLDDSLSFRLGISKLKLVCPKSCLIFVYHSDCELNFVNHVTVVTSKSNTTQASTGKL